MLCITEKLSRTEETLPEMLRSIAEEMEDDEWSDSDCAVLIVRDTDTGILTFCEWGEHTAQLIDSAYHIKRTQA